MQLDLNKTEKWWIRLCNDEAQMNAWLQKLQVTEIDGYNSNYEDEKTYNKDHDKLVKRMMLKTGDDEKRHSDLLVKLIENRGLSILEDQTPTSIYWETMQKGIYDLNSCCAVYYLGEKLASLRFEFIQKHPLTPKDVLEFINSALPDEQYHAKTYLYLAGEQAIQDMNALHKEAMYKLTGGK